MNASLMAEFVRDVDNFEMQRIIETLRTMRFISVVEKLGKTILVYNKESSDEINP